MAFTLSDLISKARTRADMVNSDFVSDADVTEMVNVSYSELYEFLVQTFEDYFIAETTITTVSGTDAYDLSAVSPGIFKLRGVDLQLSAAAGNAIPLRRFEWAERSRYNQAVWGSVVMPGARRPAYRLLGSKLKLAPPPDAAYDLKVYYVPAVTLLSNDTPGTTDVLPGEVRPGWEEYIVIGAAIRMLEKEQNDTTPLMAELARLKARIESAAANRDADAPVRMVRRADERADSFPFPTDDLDHF